MRQLDMYLLHMTEGVDTHMLHMSMYEVRSHTVG